MVENAPALQKMMTSLYKCCYRDFFAALVDVVDQLHLDPHLAPHARYFLRQVPPLRKCLPPRAHGAFRAPLHFPGRACVRARLEVKQVVARLTGMGSSNADALAHTQARIVAYTQYLESYHTVELSSMAATFGVGAAFLDSELSELVACGRLSCKIDKVKGVVCSNRPDSKNALYQQTIKQGDALLNRIQKLSRVITI